MWAIIIGVLVTLNILLGFASRDKGAEYLSLWLGLSFGLSLLIEVPGWVHPPLMMALLAMTDLFMTWRIAKTCRENQAIAWCFWPMSVINLAFIASHMLAVAYYSDLHVYLASLDLMFLLQLGINMAASVGGGLEIFSLFGSHRGPAHHSANSGSARGR